MEKTEKPLSAKERAAKFSERDFQTMFDWRLRELIAAEIQQAEREAREEVEADRDRWADSACRLEKAIEKVRAEAYSSGYKEGFKAGAEAAAKLAEDQDNSECKEICACPYRISKQIRALKTPEGGKRE